MLEKTKFIQGLYSYEGAGLATAVPFEVPVVYVVPFAKRSQLIYFRAGNPSDEMIYILMLRRGESLRYFPVGARGAIHVPLAVVEDLDGDTKVEVLVGAPKGLRSSVVLDIGFVEIG